MIKSKTKITAWNKTCHCFPSQWEMVAEDTSLFKFIYARYRHGELNVGVGYSIDQAVDQSMGIQHYLSMSIDYPQEGVPDNGTMSTEAMMKFVGFEVVN